MRAFPGSLAIILLLVACGGKSAVGGEPQSAADGTESSDRASESSESTGEERPGDDDVKPEPPRGPSCEDGTCSSCGSGICPAGWYCDEKASGGGACSWLTECAAKPTCACVTRVLGAACKCREESGGLKVACD